MADDYNDDEAPDDNAAPGDTDAAPAIPTPGDEQDQPITSPEDDQALQEQQANDKEHPLRKFILSLLGQSNQPQQTAQEEYDPNTGLDFGNNAPPSDTQARRGLPRLNPSTGIQLPDVSTPGGTFNPMTGERTPPPGPPSLMAPDTAAAIEHAVNKDGAIEKGEAAMHAAEYATRRAGPEAGKAYIGAKEAEYNAMRAAGAVALDHSNILTTVDAANRAFNALPDGETVNFSQGPNRTVTATVKGFNAQPIATNLSLEQMGRLLRTDFNDVMHNTVAGTVQKLTGGGTAPMQRTSIDGHAPGEIYIKGNNLYRDGKEYHPGSAELNRLGTADFTPDHTDKYPGMKGPIPEGGYRVGGGYGPAPGPHEAQILYDALKRGNRIPQYGGGPEGYRQFRNEQEQRIPDRITKVPGYMERQGVTQDMYDEARAKYPYTSQNSQRINYLRKQLDTQRGNETKLEQERIRQGWRIPTQQLKNEGGKTVAEIKAASDAARGARLDARDAQRLAVKLQEIATKHEDARVRQAGIQYRDTSKNLQMFSGKTYGEVDDIIKKQFGIDAKQLFGGQWGQSAQPAQAGQGVTPSGAGGKVYKDPKTGKEYIVD